MNNKKVIYILIILIFCIGIYLCVPQIINFISTKKEIQSALTLADEIDIKQNDKLYNLMVQYNTNLAQGSQKLFSSENVYKEPDFLLKDNGIDNCEILGKIYIPKINIQLALYNGAKEEYMKKLEDFIQKRTEAVKGLNNQYQLRTYFDYAAQFYKQPAKKSGGKKTEKK